MERIERGAIIITTRGWFESQEALETALVHFGRGGRFRRWYSDTDSRRMRRKLNAGAPEMMPATSAHFLFPAATAREIWSRTRYIPKANRGYSSGDFDLEPCWMHAAGWPRSPSSHLDARFISRFNYRYILKMHLSRYRTILLRLDFYHHRYINESRIRRVTYWWWKK